MAPTNPCITAQLRQHICYHLDNNLLKNALFFSERLIAYDTRSPESAYLLALCHLRSNDFRSAFEYAKGHGQKGLHLGCAYVFAQACLELERYREGIGALEKSRGQWGGRNSFAKHSPTVRHLYPDAAAVNCLLGKLYYAHDEKRKAISYFEETLKLNPFMWDAFTALCDMGATVRVPNIFKMSPEMEMLLRTNAKEEVMTLKDAVLNDMLNDHTQNRARPASVVIGDSMDPFNNVPPRGVNGGLFASLSMTQKLGESNPSISNIPANGGHDGNETPSGPTTAESRREANVISAYTIEPPQAPMRRNRGVQGDSFSMDAPPKMNRATTKRTARQDASEGSDAPPTRIASAAPVGIERKRTISGQVIQSRQAPLEDPAAPQRRSVRLFNQIRPTSKTSNTIAGGPSQTRELKKARPPISRIMRPGTTTSTVGRVVSGNRKPVEDNNSMDVDQKEYLPRMGHHTVTVAPAVPPKPEPETAKQEEALRFLLDLFKKLGSGYFALSQFRCSEALQSYLALPRSQQETPWVLAQIGRAYYEQAQYAEAEGYFKRLRTMAPTRFEDMEVYSTILWHLKRETDLSFLAHELVDADWTSQYAWVAMGNAWSLARDHEAALKCFKRATQINPKFAYAFTLQGHEHVLNEEYEKAMLAYRRGIASDNRHYNAYYGVARVYDKLGEYDKATQHFAAASRINPTNAVLITWMGSVLEKQKQYQLALKYFTRATELAPRSALTRYKKARSHMAMGDTQRALQELMILKDLAPDEAMVHFTLGKLYKMLKEKGLAVRHFTIALNLDPKGSSEVKSAIETLDDEDEDEESSMMTA